MTDQEVTEAVRTDRLLRDRFRAAARGRLLRARTTCPVCGGPGLPHRRSGCVSWEVLATSERFHCPRCVGVVRWELPEVGWPRWGRRELQYDGDWPQTADRVLRAWEDMTCGTEGD